MFVIEEYTEYRFSQGEALNISRVANSAILATMKLKSINPLLPAFLIVETSTNEPRREKTGFLHMRKKKTQISLAVTAKLIGAFVFATRIVQSLYCRN